MIARFSPSIAARVLSLLLIVAALATAPFTTRLGGVMAMLAVGLLVLVTRPEPRTLLKRAAIALLGVAALALPIALTEPERAALVSARATLALTAALAIASTIPSGQLGPALSALGVPAGFAAVITSMLRQFGLLSAEGRRLLLARRLRGARGAAVSTEVLATLLVKSAARAERVELGMRLRGYDERQPPSDVPLRLSDLSAVGLALLAALAIQVAARL